MLVSLYTVRVVLETLGVEDYGTYNVVAGVVTMFSFLSNAMATASQRYFSFELGRGNSEQLRKIFSLNIIIYALIGFLILLLGETIGLWFVNNKLMIPFGRESAAMWVYQFTIISFLFTIITSPYMAMIIAHEDMKVYAYMSVVDVLLKLGVVFVLRLIQYDKLQVYGILMFASTAITTSIYRAICLKRYKECKFSFYWDKNLFKEITSYSGWSLFGAAASILNNHILNIILNQFFGPIVIAARSIAMSVSHAATSFSHNLSAALRPQIIKSYAIGQKESMFLLMFRGSKVTYLLVYLFVLPLILEMPVVLELWLKNPPEYTILFTRLILLEALILSISYPIMAAAHATGKIRLYQSIVGGLLLLNIPISWVSLLMGAPPYSVMIIAIIMTVLALIARLLILKRLIDYSILKFIRVVLMPICTISIISAILPMIVNYHMTQSILQLCLVASLSAISVMLCSYFIGLNKYEQQKVKDIVNRYIFK